MEGKTATYDIINAGPRNRFLANGRVVSNSGRLTQVQNYPSKQLLSVEDTKEGIISLKLGVAGLLGDDVMLLAKSALRYTIKAADGMKLLVSDLSNIEGRCLAYLAGEEWKVKAFQEFDAGLGPDMYKLAYAKPFGVDVNTVTKDQRNYVGKVLELACLSGTTKVLTDTGWKYLMVVSKKDKLWDGENWVEHEGVVFNGMREIVDVDGVLMTSDHKILSCNTWAEARILAEVEVERSTALYIGLKSVPERLPPFVPPNLPAFQNTGDNKIAVYDVLNCGPNNRFMIKTNTGYMISHNCGYAGGVNAVITFATSFGLELNSMAKQIAPNVPKDIWDEAENFYEWLAEKDEKAAKESCLKETGSLHQAEEFNKHTATKGLRKETFVAMDSLKRLWRREHPATVQLWRDCEDAVRDAVTIPKVKFPFGNGCYASRSGKWVQIVLPSGHVLCYPGMEIDEKGALRFKGVNQFTKKWGWIKTFSGKLVENIVQSFARDVFKYGQRQAEKEGYLTILPVHDELVCEVPDTEGYSIHKLEEIMATTPPWAEGLPLAAEGFEDYVYHK